MADGTCETCKHAVAVDPSGWWRRSCGYDWPTTHVHCSQVDYVPLKAHVMLKSRACTFTPSRWESKGESASYDGFLLSP